MITWRSRPVLWLVLVLLLGVVACDRPAPGGVGVAGDLPTIVPTAGLGGEDGDPEVGGGQGEVVLSPPPPYPAPSGMTETTPRETAEPAATTVPVPSPTPAAAAEEELTGETTEGDSAEADDPPAATTGEEETAEPAAQAPEEEAASSEAAVSAEESASGESAAPAMPRTHTVAAGENLYRIGLRYGLSWVTIAQVNGLTNANRITVGQVLVLPAAETPGTGGQPVPTPGTGQQPTPSPQTETTYTVRPNDNLFRIGLAYGIGWVQIAEANGLISPSQIYVGQVLKIPVNRPGPMPEFTHQVRAGESLLRIALLYGIPWTTIAEANNLTSPYVIYPGQTLVIPGQ